MKAWSQVDRRSLALCFLLWLAVCVTWALTQPVSPARVTFDGIARAAGISETGSCAATGTSCSLSSSCTGCVNVFFAYRSNSATPPTLPSSSYFTIGTKAQSTTSARLYCKVANSSSDISSGTAATATHIAGLSFSATNVPSNLSAACAGMGVGQGVFSGATTNTTASFGALTILNSNDWVAGFLGDSAGSLCTPTGMTQRTSSGDVAALDSNATVSSWAAHTCAVASSTWITASFALQAPPQTSSMGPVFKRGYFFPGCSSGFANCSTTAPLLVMDGTGSCPSAPCPRYAGANDLVAIAASYPSAATLTIHDSTGGSNTWTADASVTDGFSMTHSVVRSCLSATTSSLTPTLSTAEGNWQYQIFVLYNTTCGTSSPVDGTSTCTADITPSMNFGSALQAGAVTSSAPNSLFLQFAWDENNGSIGMQNQAFAFGFGDNAVGMTDDWTSNSSGGTGAGGYAIQYMTEPNSSVAVNLGMNFVQTTFDTFTTCEVAYKSGTGGVIPSSHIALVRSQGWYWGSAVTNPVVNQFPSIPGNMVALTADSGEPAWSIFGTGTQVPTDNNGNSLVALADTVDPTIDAQLAFNCNATLTTNETWDVTPGTASGSNLLVWYEFTNANAGSSSACLDTGATVGTGTQTPTATSTNQLTATNSGACWSSTSNTPSGGGFTGYPICAPGAGNSDLFIAVATMGTGPITGASTLQFDYAWGSGVGDNSSATNGNGTGHTFSASQVSANWTSTGTSGVQAIMALFKESSARSTFVPQIGGFLIQ